MGRKSSSTKETATPKDSTSQTSTPGSTVTEIASHSDTATDSVSNSPVLTTTPLPVTPSFTTTTFAPITFLPTQTTSSTPVGSPANNVLQPGSSKTTIGLIIGGAIGWSILLILLAFLGYRALFKRKRYKTTQAYGGDHEDSLPQGRYGKSAFKSSFSDTPVRHLSELQSLTAHGSLGADSQREGYQGSKIYNLNQTQSGNSVHESGRTTPLQTYRNNFMANDINSDIAQGAHSTSSLSKTIPNTGNGFDRITAKQKIGVDSGVRAYEDQIGTSTSPDGVPSNTGRYAPPTAVDQGVNIRQMAPVSPYGTGNTTAVAAPKNAKQKRQQNYGQSTTYVAKTRQPGPPFEERQDNGGVFDSRSGTSFQIFDPSRPSTFQSRSKAFQTPQETQEFNYTRQQMESQNRRFEPEESYRGAQMQPDRILRERPTSESSQSADSQTQEVSSAEQRHRLRNPGLY